MKMYHKIRIWLAIKIQRLRPHLLSEKEQEKISILGLRACFNFFGFDTTDMSDDEIKQGVNDLSKCLGKTGCTAQELVEASNRLAGLLA